MMSSSSRVIKVSKQQLEEKLRENLAEHAAKVQKAQAVYRQLVIDELDTRLAEARAGKPIDPSFLHRLPVPRDYSDEYRRALRELDWDVSSEIQLSSDDFRRFVLDEWEWQQQFIASNSVYLVE